jgi:ketosteroid isomerase-like protein
MSHENVEIVRAAIEAYNRGDWDAALKDAGPDFEFDLSRAIGPQHGVYGRDQVQQAWSEFADSWQNVRIEPDEFIEVGESVVVLWTTHVVGRDGLAVQSRVAWVFTIRDGAMDRACIYQERDAALEAAGLSA